MATLTKTDVVPPKELNALLNQFALKMVILVNDPELADKADYLSQNPPLGFERKVIWIPNPDFAQLAKRFPGLSADITNIQAFSLSSKNIVSHVIKKDEVVDYALIGYAFSQAGLHQYN